MDLRFERLHGLKSKRKKTGQLLLSFYLLSLHILTEKIIIKTY